MAEMIPFEPKYAINTETGEIVNRQTGNPIPKDEPVMLFRAQDLLLPDMLSCYISLTRDRQHKLAAAIRLTEILRWQLDNPLRVKEPDTVLDENWGPMGVPPGGDGVEF